MPIKKLLTGKIILSSVLFILLLTFGSCSSDDDSPTAPENSNTVINSATIGIGGGSLTSDHLELNVPPGSFTTDVKITLTETQEDGGFDNKLSKEYKFEGLPQTFSKPLTIKMKYNGDLTDNSYIAIGEVTYVKSLDAENTSYRLLSAHDSSGYLVATIPPASESGLFKSNSNSSFDEGGISFNALAIAGYASYVSQQGHFRITFPTSLVTKAYNLASYLEMAYSKFQNLGFSYSRRTKWPIEVTVKKLGSSIYGYSMNSVWGNNYGYMEFNSDKMNDDSELLVTAGHEFFHLVQSLYDSRNSFSKAKFQSPNLWLDEACAVWAEGLFSNNTSYVSPIFDTNAFEILNGAKESSGDNAQSYGYGMASFIKYLVKKQGNSSLVDLYEKIYSGKNPFYAISSVLPISMDFSWKSYLKDLYLFKLYNGGGFRPPSVLATAKMKNHNFRIQSAEDSVKTFKSELSDLSATIFSVKNEFDKLNPAAKLKFTCMGWSFQIYKISSSTSEFLMSGKDTLTLKDFKKLTDSGYQIAAVLYNDDLNSPYTNSKDYEMEIKVIAPKTISWIYLTIGYSGTFRFYDPSIGQPTENVKTTSMGTEFSIWSNDIQINGNTIIAHQDTTTTYNHYITDVTIEFADINNPVNIVSFTFNERQSSVSYSVVTTYSAAASGVPFNMEDYGNTGILFEYAGNIASYLTSLSYNYVMTRTDDQVTEELLNYNSDGNIQIIVDY